MKVTIIGSGHVAEAFAVALHANNVEVVQVVARNRERGEALAEMAEARYCAIDTPLDRADLYLIAVSDRAVAEVAASLQLPEGGIVAHTAGCGLLEWLPQSHRRAVIYPFQTFSSGRKVDFRQIPIFIEAEEPTTHDEAAGFASLLSDSIYDADAEVRRHIHLAGVFASNFSNHMYACATAILDRVGLPFSTIAPVIGETAAKAIASGDPKSVQTGPAARGDVATRERHTTLLGDDPMTEIYNKISDNIWQTKISKR